MKHLLQLSALAAVLAVSAAQAQVNVYITGATAFRKNAHLGIQAMYNGGAAASLNADNADVTKANKVTYAGTMPALFGGQTVNVFASYSGSVEGVQSLTENANVTFFASSTPGNTATISHAADLAFSDVFQASTIYGSPDLIDDKAGIIPFAYVKGAGTQSVVTNVTIQHLQVLLLNGFTRLQTFNFANNATTDAIKVYALMRDAGSGTRMTSERDAFIIGDPNIYQPNGAGVWTPGFAGYTSGSFIVDQLKLAANGPCLGILGMSDAQKAVVGGAAVLAYNGQLPFTNGDINNPDLTPVKTGQYSLWGYEHLFNRDDASQDVLDFKAALLAEVSLTIDGKTAIKLADMKVTRPADGGPITKK